MRNVWIAAPAWMFALGGCSVLFPEDSRSGKEPLADCSARVLSTFVRVDRNALIEGTQRVVPTFTFDVTKLDLEDLQELSADSTGQSDGAALRRSTNETSTAVTRFMEEPVDEDGALFLGSDPALYRVRGTPVTLRNAVAMGCERQREGMRLIDVSWRSAASQTNTETGS